MDFLDWFSNGTDYIGDLFKEAADGAGEYLTSLFSPEAPAPELLGGDGPVSMSAEPDTLGPPPATPDAPATDGVMTVDKLVKSLNEMSPEMKKNFESMLNNKMLMQGLSTGFAGALKTRAQDKMLAAQRGQQDDEQQFTTAERQRRGAPPTAIAKTSPRGLTEGYLKG